MSINNEITITLPLWQWIFIPLLGGFISAALRDVRKQIRTKPKVRGVKGGV